MISDDRIADSHGAPHVPQIPSPYSSAGPPAGLRFSTPLICAFSWGAAMVFIVVLPADVARMGFKLRIRVFHSCRGRS